MLRLYLTTLSEDVMFDEDKLPLSAYRVEKLRKVSAPLVRRQMVAAELLLNRAVRDQYPQCVFPLRMRTGERGKPFFPDLPLFFSLSHSGPFVTCAIADHEIGVDLQVCSPMREALVKRCFSGSEQRFVRESPDGDAAFTELWCLKESYLKATGEGLTRPLADFSLDLQGPITLTGSDRVRFWQYKETHFCLAVCSLDGREPVPDAIIKEELRP